MWTEVIDGVCLESRIGGHCNNPSIDYGGYCLPKDTKRLLTLQGRAAEPDRGHRGGQPHPQGLLGRRGAAEGVEPRLRGQAEAGRGRLPPDDEVELRQLPRELHPGRHEAREGQGRARGCLRAHAGRAEFFGSEVTHDLEAFKAGCDVIVANRWSDELADVADKVYTRDLFKRD